MPSSSRRDRAAPGGWTFVTHHALVLACLRERPGPRLREVAERLGLSERAVQNIVRDLEAAGYLTRSKAGRRNRYALHLERPLRNRLAPDRAVGELVCMLDVPPRGER